MEKERRWKIKQAKRFVFAVVRGRHDLESRVLRQEREDELRIRRVAKNIAGEVRRTLTTHDKENIFLQGADHKGETLLPLRVNRGPLG